MEFYCKYCNDGCNTQIWATSGIKPLTKPKSGNIIVCCLCECGIVNEFEVDAFEYTESIAAENDLGGDFWDLCGDECDAFSPIDVDEQARNFARRHNFLEKFDIDPDNLTAEQLEAVKDYMETESFIRSTQYAYREWGKAA